MHGHRSVALTSAFALVLVLGCTTRERGGNQVLCFDLGAETSTTTTTQAPLDAGARSESSPPLATEAPEPAERAAAADERGADERGADRLSFVGSAVERDQNLGLVHVDGGVIDVLGPTSLGPAPGAGASASTGRAVPATKPFDAVPHGVDTTAPGGAAAGRRADNTIVGPGGYEGQ